MTCYCANCGAPFEQQTGPGRPRKYCKRSCRQRRYEHARRSLPVGWKTDFLKAHGWKCYLCDNPLSEDTMTVDHIRPLSKGGPDVFENMAPACIGCNLDKAARLISEVLNR